MNLKLLFLIMISFNLVSAELTKINKDSVDLDLVYQGKGVLWGFDFINDDQIIISHKKKGVVLYNLNTKESKKLKSPQFKTGGQGGLLDIVFYKGYVYLTYSKEMGEKVVTALAKGAFKNNEINDLRDIYVTDAHGGSSRHFGSRILILNESIFMTVGERAQRNLAQSLESDHGKILRLTLEGKPHPENSTSSKNKAIYSYGHRNPQGIVNVGDRIYSCEFGPRGGDELNLIEEGKNYGWPVITYGSEYWGPSIGDERKPGMEQPIHYWVPSISPSGMEYYDSDKIKKFKDYFLLANLSSTHIRMIKLKENKVENEIELLSDLSERFRHIRLSSKGDLYFSTDSGKLYHLKGLK
jgi:glucose/arabinose dehydrogenase